MTLNGKILNISTSEFSDCILVIKYGKIQEITIEDAGPLQLWILQESNNKDFTIEKHYDTKKSPYNSNYIVNYSSYAIYLKLSMKDIIRLYYHSKKLLIQSDDMKKDMLKYIAGGIIGFVGSFLLQNTNDTNSQKKAEPVSKQKVILKK